jgi:hypothetical protein
LDDFRSSLTPFMVEALICTQDWLKRAPSIPNEEEEEELAKLEQGTNHAPFLFIRYLIQYNILFHVCICICSTA